MKIYNRSDLEPDIVREIASLLWHSGKDNYSYLYIHNHRHYHISYYCQKGLKLMYIDKKNTCKLFAK